MTEIQPFEQLHSDERERILQNRISTRLTALRTTLGFEDLGKDSAVIDPTTDFEAPPIVMDEKHLAQILVYSPPTHAGRWIRTLVRIYLAWGRVHYRQLEQDKFLVTVTFPPIPAAGAADE
ncbi:MAG: hypothetical protein IPJ87_02015 [Flavobacteriales bacterium]|nr:hypothetical protein [Flavobacteriales bacterium]MBK8950387.1 hypothetical protein [Flavobacteriales bacterium]MBK9700932.1 hypothetical protein [Flavobacteriales bacterium]